MTGPTRSVIVAADPNHSICAWRGANPRLLEQFRLEHSANLNVRMLQVNHRGTRTMVEAATTLAGSDRMPGLVHDYQSAIRVEGPRPTLTEFEDRPEAMDRHILDSAKQLADEGYRWEDMACIYRTHRSINRMVTQLISRNVPHTILGETHRERDSNARCIAALLALTLNPADRKAFAAAASLDARSRKRELNPELVRAVAGLARKNGTGLVEAAEEYMGKLRPETPAHRSLQYVTGAWRELDRMLDDPEAELHDFCRRASGLLQEAQRAGPGTAPEPETYRLLALSQTIPRMGQESPREFLARFLELQAASLRPDLRAAENGDPLEPERGMTFATIHASKGMQWKIVWVVDADNNSLPNLRRGREETDMGEEERVFYVAATRATDQLHFCCSTRTDKGHDAEPSPFLDVLGDLLERRTMAPELEEDPAGMAWMGEDEPEPEPDFEE